MRIPRRAALLLLLLLLPGCVPGVRPGGPAGGRAEAGQALPPHVVLVSIDGFRPDYLERGVTPALEAVARRGARVEALVPVFPTKTFTNHYSLVTGLYADRHGIVSNRFYDPELDAFYRVPGQTGVGDGHWYGGEPIWVLAERNGMRTGTMFWPGSEAAIGGVRPTYWHVFDPHFDEVARVDTVLAWLGRPVAERPRLVTLYLNSVDDAGHTYGPDAPELNAAVARADSLVARLFDGIARSPVADAVNVVIVSDHGMTEFREWIYLDDVVDLDGVIAVMTEPSASLWFRGDSARMDAVHATLRAGLRNARVYRRHELPAAWRVRDNPRIGDVLVMPDEHFRVGLRREGAARVGGLHGYEAIPSMHGILLAAGPRFGAGSRTGPVESVHVYPLLAQLLGLPVADDIDGRPDRLAPLLRRGAAAAGNVHTAGVARMINIAHRGASGHAPEHTIAAFDQAFEWGVDYLEQDLQMTADGVLVVMHDETLDRTARGPAELCTGPVSSRTLAELRQCEVGSWFNQKHPDRARPEFARQRIPTLEELFQRYGQRANYYIETKNPESAPGMEEKLIELLVKYDLRRGAVERRQVLIQSFSEASLRKLHGLDPELPLVQLLPGPEVAAEPGTDLSAELRPQLAGIAEYAVAIGPSRLTMDHALVRAAHRLDLQVHVYTVNLRLEMERLWNMGADGIFTDFPDRLREMQRARGDTPPARQQPIE